MNDMINEEVCDCSKIPKVVICFYLSSWRIILLIVVGN